MCKGIKRLKKIVFKVWDGFMQKYLIFRESQNFLKDSHAADSWIT